MGVTISALKKDGDSRSAHTNISSNRSRVKHPFLPLLLRCISEDLRLSQIAKKTGKTKQALNYHIRKFVKLGVIRRIQSYPYSIYELTSLGSSVKKSLEQSEHLRSSLWKAHNLIVGFEIISFGDFRFVETRRRKLVTGMKNWNYAREMHGDHVINIQDTGLLKIYAPAKYCKDPDVAFGEMFSKATTIAQWYVHKYGMRLRPMKVIRKGEKALVGSEKLAKIFGRIKTEELYINASEGTEELEAPQDSYAIENLLKLPEIIETKLVPTLDQFSKNIELHLEVLQDIRDAVKDLKKT